MSTCSNLRRKRTAAGRRIALLMFLAWTGSAFSSSALGQVGLMPIPTLQGVQVSAETTLDVGTELYTYGYTVSNPASNTGQIWNIQVDVTSNSSLFFNTSALTIPKGGVGLKPFFQEVADLSPLALPPNLTLVPFGQQVPTGWNGGLMRNGLAYFTSGEPAVRILPGQTLSGFALVSPGMPTIRKIKVNPKWTYVVPEVHVTDDDEEIAAAQVKKAIIFSTFTLGPSGQTPGTFAHWDQVRDDLNQAIQLGWIPDQALANALVSQLESARAAFNATDGTLAKSRLDTLIQTITDPALTPAQRRREAFDLVLLNAQRLKESTPDTVFPFEPNITLSPQSSTRSVGAEVTLTARVINLGNPAKPPITNRSVTIFVSDGPNVGPRVTGNTDAEGKLTFTYTGTQVGTDTITAIYSGISIEIRTSAEANWSGGPDLVVPLFAPPLLKSESGKTVFITEWTSNLGNVASTPSITRYFISADPQLDPTTAQLIGERPIPALEPGEQSQGGTVTFTLPDNLPLGVYNLAACADAGMTVVELDENNNCSFSQLVGQTSVVLALERGANLPPVADAGPDRTVECTAASGATVTLNGTASSDPDGDPLTFTWTNSFGTVLGQTPQVTLPLGAHTITLTVDDGKGGSASDTVKITVADTKPPTVTAALTPLASEKKSLKRREREGDERERRGDEGKRGDDDDDRRDRDGRNEFRVVALATDRCDAHPLMQASINGVAVTDGQVVRLELDDDNKVRRKNGLSQIAASNIVLTVSATDASGNRATATAKLAKKQREHDD